MGMLVNGRWQRERSDTTTADGRFERPPTAFHDRVTADGSSGFPAEAGRYHLYVSHACPWSHRTLIARALKGLEEAISISVVDPVIGEDGWTFSERMGAIPDSVNGCDHLWQVYVLADPAFTGRVTVPVLWDRERRAIVNNESAEILRMLGREFDAVAGDASLDLYPALLAPEIDRVNAYVYECVNDGVYRAGFATTQDAYDEAFQALFDALDWLDDRLGHQRWLVGDALTEADWRLFTTLVRFDPVYHYLFKCNRRRLDDYAHLGEYLRELYQVPRIASTVHMDHIKTHYYRSHPRLNPTGIVPRGPEIDLGRPHRRDHVGGERVDEAGRESFPASDPPPWTPG